MLHGAWRVARREKYVRDGPKQFNVEVAAPGGVDHDAEPGRGIEHAAELLEPVGAIVELRLLVPLAVHPADRCERDPLARGLGDDDGETFRDGGGDWFLLLPFLVVGGWHGE